MNIVKIIERMENAEFNLASVKGLRQIDEMRVGLALDQVRAGLKAAKAEALDQGFIVADSRLPTIRVIHVGGKA